MENYTLPLSPPVQPPVSKIKNLIVLGNSYVRARPHASFRVSDGVDSATHSKRTVLILIDDSYGYTYTHPEKEASAKENLKFQLKLKEVFPDMVIKGDPNAPINWNRRFLKMAAGEINTWSKDPSTKVSATVFKDKYPIASSYNGFPPGIADTAERLNNREVKYKLVQHAEANAIATCARLGIATEGCTMAVTHMPCSTCAGMMLSAGIKKVIVQKPTDEFLSRWKDSVELSMEMFKEAGVELVVLDLGEEE